MSAAQAIALVLLALGSGYVLVDFWRLLRFMRLTRDAGQRAAGSVGEFHGSTDALPRGTWQPRETAKQPARTGTREGQAPVGSHAHQPDCTITAQQCVERSAGAWLN